MIDKFNIQHDEPEGNIHEVIMTHTTVYIIDISSTSVI